MSSILDNIEETFHSGDVEALKRWVVSELEKRDLKITYLQKQIVNLSKEIDVLTTAQHNKVNKIDFDEYVYQTRMRYEN